MSRSKFQSDNNDRFLMVEINRQDTVAKAFFQAAHESTLSSPLTGLV